MEVASTLDINTHQPPSSPSSIIMTLEINSSSNAAPRPRTSIRHIGRIILECGLWTRHQKFSTRMVYEYTLLSSLLRTAHTQHEYQLNPLRTLSLLLHRPIYVNLKIKEFAVSIIFISAALLAVYKGRMYSSIRLSQPPSLSPTRKIAFSAETIEAPNSAVCSALQ